MRVVRRAAVSVVGLAILLGGVALLVLPGPGILLIAAGLGVLATEFRWARRLVGTARERAEEAQRAAVASPVRMVLSMLFAAGLVALGVTMFVVTDVAWPILDSWADAGWSPVTGGVLVASGLLVLTTSAVTIRRERAR